MAIIVLLLMLVMPVHACTSRMATLSITASPCVSTVRQRHIKPLNWPKSSQTFFFHCLEPPEATPGTIEPSRPCNLVLCFFPQIVILMSSLHRHSFDVNHRPFCVTSALLQTYRCMIDRFCGSVTQKLPRIFSYDEQPISLPLEHAQRSTSRRIPAYTQYCKSQGTRGHGYQDLILRVT
jgi:hypothetical protein